ncbi:hypothetical protein CI610_02199 [invertebrate metagenome]|uniref:DUF2878 domain-containing protein n=1 Tax=invertebrate metagenome TaxID=1711999 RepID=A0A2H9T6L2_9ZZZZ
MIKKRSIFFPARIVESALFNGIWFYAVWFSAVSGRQAWLGVTLLLLLLHFALVLNKDREVLLALPVVCVGIVIDGLLSIFRVFIFDQNSILPVWLLCLWIAFSTTLIRSLSCFSKPRWLSCCAGGIGGPLSYWGGQQLGAVTFGYSLGFTLSVLSAVWVILLPSCFWIAQQMDKKIEPNANEK